nr:PREDICTED: cytochrome P450 4C1-like isoform X1 [Linepithema humile]
MSTIIFASVVLTTLVCVAISYLFLNYRRRQSFIKAVNTLPGPRLFPFIGNIYIFAQKNLDFLYVIDTMIDIYPSPFRFWIGNKAFIEIYDADQIKTVLQSRCFDKSLFYDTAKPLFGEGLITSPTFTWIPHRKLAGPTFNTHNLRGFFNKFVEHSLIFTDELEKLNKNEIIFHKPILKTTVDIACETLMDVKLESETINEAFEVFTRKFSYRDNWNYILLGTLWNLNAVLNFTKIGKIIRRVSKVRNCIMNELEQSKSTLIKPDITENNKREKTLFTNFWEAYRGKSLTRKEFYDNIISIILAASDTTAVVMYFVTFVLANLPEIQEKAYKELLGIYGNKSPKSAPVKYEDLQHMDYLTRVIKETMRMFPAVPAIGRCLREDLKIGEFTLPKGVDVIIPIVSVHRNKKYWPNPLMFDPDRFLPEKKVDSSNYYIPFSDGLRNCIGAKYAMMSMKVILATLIRTFEFKTDKKIKVDEIKLKMNITLEPVNPIKVKIEKRDLQ